jgi:hypothetical protein
VNTVRCNGRSRTSVCYAAPALPCAMAFGYCTLQDCDRVVDRKNKRYACHGAAVTGFDEQGARVIDEMTGSWCR